MNKYSKQEKIGEGTYGVVYKAISKNGQAFALKKIRLESDAGGIPPTAIREIALLKQLKHPNIVKLVDVLYTEKKLFLVFEYIDKDLKKLLDVYDNGLDLKLVKDLLFQTLKGVSYCHANHILHRDLKPQNLLISNEGQLKLADFGLARAFGIPARTFSHEVVTLWYRSPDLLMGNHEYGIGLDMWSVGCIFAEMLNGRPFFAGTTVLNQLSQIFSILGEIDLKTWPGAQNLSLWKIVNASMINFERQDLFKLIPKINEDGLDLLLKMLHYNPEKRITAEQAMRHSYFHDP